MSETVVNSPPLNNRARFRFGLRTLLATVAAVGLLLGWFTYHLNWIHERREAISELDDGAGIYFRTIVPKTIGTLPLGLWIMGDKRVDLIYLWVESGESRDSFNKRKTRFQRLFPEADVPSDPRPTATP